MVKNIFKFILFLLLVVISTSVMVSISFFVPEIILSPDDTMYWFFSKASFILFAVYEILLIVMLLYIIFLSEERETSPLVLIFVLLISTVASAYGIIFDTTYVTDKSVKQYSAVNPCGTLYSYEDVIGVDTGFYGEKSGIKNVDGDFYYCIRTKDGKRIDISRDHIINEKVWNRDVYEKLIQIDTEIMSQKAVVKISSSDNIDFSSENEENKLKILEIIKNR